MTKPATGMCAQRRLRSAWAFAQPDQILRCPHEEALGVKSPLAVLPILKKKKKKKRQKKEK